jgi:hypothetical protein
MKSAATISLRRKPGLGAMRGIASLTLDNLSGDNPNDYFAN